MIKSNDKEKTIKGTTFFGTQEFHPACATIFS